MIVKQGKSRRKNISPNTFKKLVHVVFPQFMHWLEIIEATTQIKQQFSEQTLKYRHKKENLQTMNLWLAEELLNLIIHIDQTGMIKIVSSSYDAADVGQAI